MANGLPTGMMIIGKRFHDATVLRVAHTFEQSVGGFPAPAGTAVGGASRSVVETSTTSSTTWAGV
jgi:amidase